MTGIWYHRRDFDKGEYLNDVTTGTGPISLRDPVRESHFMLFRFPQAGIVYSLQPFPRTNTSNYWHKRFGHLPIEKIRTTFENGAIRGVPWEHLRRTVTCIGCEKFKPHLAPRSRVPRESLFTRGQCWHIDIVNQGKTKSLKKHSYIMMCQDEATDYRAVYYLRARGEAIECIASLIAWCKKNMKVDIIAIKGYAGMEKVTLYVQS